MRARDEPSECVWVQCGAVHARRRRGLRATQRTPKVALRQSANLVLLKNTIHAIAAFTTPPSRTHSSFSGILTPMSQNMINTSLTQKTRGLRDRTKTMEELSYFLVGKIEHKPRLKSVCLTTPYQKPSTSPQRIVSALSDLPMLAAIRLGSF